MGSSTRARGSALCCGGAGDSASLLSESTTKSGETEKLLRKRRIVSRRSPTISLECIACPSARSPYQRVEMLSGSRSDRSISVVPISGSVKS